MVDWMSFELDSRVFFSCSVFFDFVHGVRRYGPITLWITKHLPI